MSDGEIVVKLSLEDGGYKVAVVSAGRAMKEFKQSLDSTASSIKRVEEHQFSLGRKFRDLVMTMGALRFVAMDVNDIFLRLPLAILKTAGELERMQVLMKGLSKELTEAGRASEGLRDFKFVTNMAKNAPFEIGALSDSFVKLKTAGIDPTNGSMKALVDSVAQFGGTGESLKRASVAIQQMAGKGVISMEELRQQLGEAVPTAMQDMADGMGVSMAELAKIVQTGTLAAGPALAKMLIQMRMNNEGAAAEMMKTWVGMTSRLKTEWDLAAKSIADAGFADESKKAVQELIDLLGNEEFKRFGVQMGEVLGTVVSDMVYVTKAVVKYREEIVFLVQAWLAYKTITSLVAPISKALELGSINMAKSLRENTVGAMASATAHRNMVASQVRDNMVAAESNALRLSKKLAADQAELASVRARNAQILAEDRKLRAALAFTGGVQIPGQGGKFQPPAAGHAYLANLSRENSTLIARQRELKAQMDATTIAMNASTVQTMKKARELTALQNVTRLQTAATIAATGATKLFGGAMALMGGPIGVAILAITGLVYMYNKVAGAAEESAARQKRANAGLSDAKEKAELDKDLASAERLLARAESRSREQYTFDETKGGMAPRRKKTAADAKLDADAIEAAAKKVQEARKAATNAGISVLQASVREEVNAANWAHETKVREITSASQMEQLAFKAEANKRLLAVKGDAKKEQAVKNQINKERLAATVRGVNERLAAEVAAENAAGSAARNATTEQERAKQLAILEARTASREQLEKELKNLEDGLAGKINPGAGKPKKEPKGPNLGDKDTPLQRLVESIAAERARLDAELDNFNETEGKGDKAAGIVARLMEKWEKNEFKDPITGKNPSKKLMESVASDAAANQRAKEAQKAREELAQKAGEFAEFVKGMEPEYLDAIEVLMDPLGKIKVGRSEKKIDKMLAGMTPEELQAAATRLGTTVDNVRAELVNKAQTIDTVSFFQNVAQETEQLNASMVDDSREAAVARMKADNDRHAQEMKNLYEKRQASGEATGAELLQLQSIMEASVKARAAKLANESRSPLEKLGAQWGNVTKNMEEATSRWAESAADAFTNMAITGKMNFKDMAISILADLAKIQIKAALSPWLNLAGNFIAGMFGGGGASPGKVDYSLGSSGGGGGLGLSRASFANGGIMTEFGSAPLKKYANGGIANSPQLALFGEGKTPEAYVPLPDGRSIPVTLKGLGAMQGGEGGDSVQINITVNQANGSESSDASGDMASAYQQMGERIKGVVREELLNQKRPGGVLYK